MITRGATKALRLVELLEQLGAAPCSAARSRPTSRGHEERTMIDDVVTFGIWYYIGRYLLYTFLFIVMLAVIHPWIIAVVLLIWLWSAAATADVGLRADSEPEGTARWHFLQEREEEQRRAAQETQGG
jgi:hypothetical protein